MRGLIRIERVLIVHSTVTYEKEQEGSVLNKIIIFRDDDMLSSPPQKDFSAVRSRICSTSPKRMKPISPTFPPQVSSAGLGVPFRDARVPFRYFF